MAKCVVPHCKPGAERELFHPPADKIELYKWKQILKVQEDEFFVCDLHFEAKHIEHEKNLTQNAYPSVLLSSNEFTNEACCCCLERFTEQTIGRKVDDKIKEIFKQHFEFEVTFQLILGIYSAITLFSFSCCPAPARSAFNVKLL